MLAETGWWHSFELPDGTMLQGVCGIEGLKERLAQFPIPQDLRGKRVLDIGAWDGWFSFEMERRGAEVVAIDCWDNPRFRQVHAALNSKVDYRQLDVYDLSPETVGRFDIVLFMGVLYHLKHPLLALEKVCSVTKELAAVESYVSADDLDPNSRPMMELFENDEFEGQTDNWVAPNVACLLAMCRIAGFARVELTQVMEFGAGAACFRQWDPEVCRDSPVPTLRGAVHNSNLGINFDSKREEYVACYFKVANDANLQLMDIQPQVSGLGVRPIGARRRDQGDWQVNFRLPPGLAPGWHKVSLRIKNSASSNERALAVDMPLLASAPVIRSACDGATWKADQLEIAKGDVISMWVEGMPENADVNNIRIVLNRERCTVIHVEEPGNSASRQVNVLVPAGLGRGAATLILEIGDCSSEAVLIQLV